MSAELQLIAAAAEPAEGHALSVLAASASAGDQAAFARLHDRLGPGLRRFLGARLAGDAEVAEELAQRAWIAVWEALRRGRYDPARAAISTFVYAVACRTMLQHRRATRRRLRWLGRASPEEAMLLATSADPAALNELGERIDAVRACLRCGEGPNALTADERRVVEAAARGEPDRAVAAALGVAPSTVHARRRSAYAKIRRALEASARAGPSAPARAAKNSVGRPGAAVDGAAGAGDGVP